MKNALPTCKIKKQIALAANILKRGGFEFPAIVTESQLINSKKSVFGFRFDPKREHRIGSVIDNKDGTLSTVRAIISTVLDEAKGTNTPET